MQTLIKIIRCHPFFFIFRDYEVDIWLLYVLFFYLNTLWKMKKFSIEYVREILVKSVALFAVVPIAKPSLAYPETKQSHQLMLYRKFNGQFIYADFIMKNNC